jgi:hypothetical protein
VRAFSDEVPHVAADVTVTADFQPGSKSAPPTRVLSARHHAPQD